jgi:hypothetical protein
VDHRPLENLTLMGKEFASRREESLGNKRHQVFPDSLRPRCAKQGADDLPERLATLLICGNGFDEGITIEPPVHVEEPPPFRDQISVPQVEWAVEIPKKRFP